MWACYVKSTNGTIDNTYTVCMAIKSMSLFLYLSICRLDSCMCRDKWFESDTRGCVCVCVSVPSNNDSIFMTLIILIIICFWLITDSACLPRSMQWNSSIVLNNRGKRSTNTIERWSEKRGPVTTNQHTHTHMYIRIIQKSNNPHYGWKIKWCAQTHRLLQKANEYANRYANVITTTTTTAPSIRR